MKADEVWAFDGEFLYVADPVERCRLVNIARVARTEMDGQVVDEDSANDKRLELAAAAPEMYRILLAIEKAIEFQGLSPWEKGTLTTDLQAVLAKAEGR